MPLAATGSDMLNRHRKSNRPSTVRQACGRGAGKIAALLKCALHCRMAVIVRARLLGKLAFSHWWDRTCTERKNILCFELSGGELLLWNYNTEGTALHHVVL